MKQTPRGSGYKKSQMSAKIACNHSELIAGRGEETSGQKANWNYHRKKDKSTVGQISGELEELESVIQCRLWMHFRKLFGSVSF